MALRARLAYTDIKVLEVLGYLPWARLYENGRDITDTLTYAELLARITQPARYATRAGRSSRH